MEIVALISKPEQEQRAIELLRTRDLSSDTISFFLWQLLPLARGHDLQAVGRLLNGHFGFTKWSYLLPLIGESTGHIDLFLTVGNRRHVVVRGPSIAFSRAWHAAAGILPPGLGEPVVEFLVEPCEAVRRLEEGLARHGEELRQAF